MTSINWSNVTTVQGVLQGVNTNTGTYGWTLVAYGVWIVLLILFSAFGLEVALLTASLIALILSFFLVYAGLMAWYWALPFIGAILFTILYIVYTAKKS